MKTYSRGLKCGSDISLDHRNCNPPPPPPQVHGPGSSKGLSMPCKAVKEFGFKRIPAGDLPQQKIAKEMEQGKEIQENDVDTRYQLKLL